MAARLGVVEALLELKLSSVIELVLLGLGNSVRKLARIGSML